MELFLVMLLALMANIFAVASPCGPHGHAKDRNARQILTDSPSVYCCESCVAAYDYGTFWTDMEDLCGWMSQGTELWKTQTYFTRDYYCHEGDAVCIHLLVHWHGYEDLLVTNVEYSGCLAYFEYAISPPGVCGSAGAQVVSRDGQWTFQATADNSADWFSAMTVNADVHCDETGRLCSVPTSEINSTLGLGLQHNFD